MLSTRHMWYYHMQDSGSGHTRNRSWEVSLWAWIAVNTNTVMGPQWTFLEKLLVLQGPSHSEAGTAPAVTLPVGTITISIRFLSALVTHRCSLQPSPGGFTHFYRPVALLGLKGHIAQRQHTSQDCLHVHLLLKHTRRVTENLSARNMSNTEVPEVGDVR